MVVSSGNVLLCNLEEGEASIVTVVSNGDILPKLLCLLTNTGYIQNWVYVNPTGVTNIDG